ncbi:MAG: DNA-processing protein DprA [Candidatus Nomurabacteria bacterium]|jgi:DNA processing protein|nr:DNA-processing protein DprA [Candidatus Nomurabacteria bacterium]
MKINEIRPQDNVFTEVLTTIAVTPKKLYYRGNLPENRPKSVAIVGSRKPTAYGQAVGYKLASELAMKGIVVISGLALGIDSVAHKGALDAGGQTIAVLGNGIDKIYPRTNVGLAQKIEEGSGAIISEYAPGTPTYPSNFLARNRIVSGLSDAIVVVEAATRSGTLSTAAHALSQGRPVFAVPGNITNPMSAGCNNLIKQGAMPLTELDDILAVIAPDKLTQANLGEVMGDNQQENDILEQIKGGENDGEVIMAKLKISTSDFNQTVTMLEIKGLVRSLGANKWAIR